MQLNVREEEVKLLLEMDTAYSSANAQEHEALVARTRDKQAPNPKARFTR